MKNIFFIAITALLFISCGGGNEQKQSVEDVLATNDLTKIRAKKGELDAKLQDLSAEIKQLTDKISELDTEKKVPLITTFLAKEEKFNHYLELQGNVQTKQNVLVYPETSGQIVRIYVIEGQRVSKGQALAQIDAAGLSDQIAQAEAQANLAKTTYERQERLWNQRIGSEIQYLQAKTSYEAQIKGINNLKKMLGKYTIRAPFSGVIDDVIKEQGIVVRPGMGSEVFRIVNLGNMYIETDVPESYITSIKKGKNVEVEFPILGEKLDSKIRQAGNFINPANRTFKIEVPVPNKDNKIKPNLTAKLKINDYTNDKAILIPQSIISENAEGKQYVYTVTDKKENKGEAKQVFIETGKTQGDYIEVLSGLEDGNEIVDEGARSVKDGQDVKILVVE